MEQIFHSEPITMLSAYILIIRFALFQNNSFILYDSYCIIHIEQELNFVIILGQDKNDQKYPRLNSLKLIIRRFRNNFQILNPGAAISQIGSYR